MYRIIIACVLALGPIGACADAQHRVHGGPCSEEAVAVCTDLQNNPYCSRACPKAPRT